VAKMTELILNLLVHSVALQLHVGNSYSLISVRFLVVQVVKLLLHSSNHNIKFYYTHLKVQDIDTS